MQRKKVISYSCLPTRLPLSAALFAYILLDHFHAASWVWGMVGTLVAVLWLGSIISMGQQDKVDIKPLLDMTEKVHIERLRREMFESGDRSE